MFCISSVPCAIVHGKIEGTGVSIYAIWHAIVRFHRLWVLCAEMGVAWHILGVGDVSDL